MQEPVGYLHGFVAHTTASNQLKPLPLSQLLPPPTLPAHCLQLVQKQTGAAIVNSETHLG